MRTRCSDRRADLCFLRRTGHRRFEASSAGRPSHFSAERTGAVHRAANILWNRRLGLRSGRHVAAIMGHAADFCATGSSAGTREANLLRGRGAALLALNVCVGRWQRTCNWLDVRSRMIGQRCLPLTAAFASPRPQHSAAAGGEVHNTTWAAEWHTVAVTRAEHTLHANARRILRTRASRTHASRLRPPMARTCGTAFC